VEGERRGEDKGKKAVRRTLRLVSSLPEQSELSTSEAASLLGVTERTVRRAIARGALPAERRGGGYRIQRGDLTRYLARQEARAPFQSAPLVELTALDHQLAPLPVPLSTFVGRDALQGRLRTLLSDPSVRLITLTGPGGVGKSRLAIAAASSVREQFPDGVVFVSLAAITRRALVIPAIADALGIQEIAGRDRGAQVQAFLRDRRLLLVLDNFEQIVSAAPDVSALASAAPGLTMLVTSRAPLRISGEHECAVPPLEVAQDQSGQEEVQVSDASRLFVARAREHQPSFVADAETAPVIAEICALLDGLPLAIELAAARVNVLTLAEMRAHLQRRLPFLTTGTRDAPQRHATMRDAIAWSYELLSPAEQALFRQLCVFTGGFTLEAAEELSAISFQLSDKQGGKAPGRQDGGPKTGDGRRSVSLHLAPVARYPTPLDLLAALVEQSLVSKVSGSDGRPRYVMLETIREFGLEQLRGEEEVWARAAHAHSLCNLAQEFGPLTKTRTTWAPVARLAADGDNLRGALEWLASSDDATSFVRLVAASYTFMFAQSHFRDAEAWLDRASAVARLAPDADRALLLIAQAELQMVKGNFAEATVQLANALPHVRAAGDPFHLALALISCGAAQNYSGHHEEGDQHFREALDCALTVENPTLRAAVEARALANRSVSARCLGNQADAVAMAERALRICQEHEFELAAARTLMDLGDIARDRGDFARSVPLYREGIELHWQRGEMRLLADGFAGIASAATVWGQARSALLLFGAAAAIRERIGYDMLLQLDVSMVDRDMRQLHALVGDREVDATLQEGRSLSPGEAMAVVASLIPPAVRPSSATLPMQEEMTPREHDVLRLLLQGHTDREIAEALYLSPRTVSWHVRAILAKLGASSRREAVQLLRDRPLSSAAGLRQRTPPP